MKQVTKTIREIVRESGKTVASIARDGGISPEYLQRLYDGEKANPSEETIIRIQLGAVADSARCKQYPDLVQAIPRLLQAKVRDATGRL
jgi:transcriptional regulator with XRE-family HTH domain